MNKMSIIHDSRPDDNWFDFFQKFNDEVMKIASILKIHTPFAGFNPHIGRATKAAYYPEFNRIIINSTHFAFIINDLLILTIAHEMRHAYQFQKWPQDKMSKILEEYQTAEPSYDDYYLSEIETDARIFASNYLLHRKNLLDLDTLKTLSVGTTNGPR